MRIAFSSPRRHAGWRYAYGLLQLMRQYGFPADSDHYDPICIAIRNNGQRRHGIPCDYAIVWRYGPMYYQGPGQLLANSVLILDGLTCEEATSEADRMLTVIQPWRSSVSQACTHKSALL